MLRLCEAGRLLHVIGARFPLERIVEAHEAQERGGEGVSRLSLALSEKVHT